MKYEKLIFKVLTVGFIATFVALFGIGMSAKSQSFGLGLSYVLPSLIALGLAIVCGFMAALAPKSPTTHQGV